jgi:hypothetical protein
MGTATEVDLAADSEVTSSNVVVVESDFSHIKLITGREQNLEIVRNGLIDRLKMRAWQDCILK